MGMGSGIDGSDRAGGEPAVSFDVSWLPVARPPMPQTCVDCGGVSLRGFIFCGWCGAKLHDETRIQSEVASRYTAYEVQPVELEVSERITLVHWPAQGVPQPEDGAPTAAINLEVQRVPSKVPPDTDPGAQPVGYERGGLCVVVLGTGPNGAFAPPSDVQMLARGDELDVVVAESGATTAFRVEDGGLRVVDCGTPRGVARKVDGAARLRDGASFRIGSTWLTYAAVRGREPHGIHGRVSILTPSGHTITSYEVGEIGLTLGRDLGDPTLALDPYIVRRHCRVVAGPNGATLEDLPESGGSYVAAAEGDFLGLGCIAVFGETAVRLDPL